MKCPCGTEKDFKECCEPFLEGEDSPGSAEALMRSRFSAFALKKVDYIDETTDPQTRERFDPAANEQWAKEVNFTKLEVMNSSEDGNKGTVEFKAYFTAPVGDCMHHEKSKFRKQAGTWYYREGKVLQSGPLKAE